MYPYIIQGSNIVVVIDNASHTINNEHPYYENIKQAIKTKDWATVKNLIDVKEVIVNFSGGNVSVKNSELYWKGAPMHNALSKRIIQMLKDGFEVAPMVNFMHNLMENPSKRAVDELYGFLEANMLPITPDGHFLAYKKVNNDYTDVYSGKIDNSVGQVVSMPRNEVDDDRTRTCSHGLHFCSEGYLKHFGGSRIMILKINPRDCVSFPEDYNNTKGRCCAYEVIGEMKGESDKAFTSVVQENGNDVSTVESLFNSILGKKYSLDSGIKESGITKEELLAFIDKVGSTFDFMPMGADLDEVVTFDDMVSAYEALIESGMKDENEEYNEKGELLSTCKSATRKRLIRKIEKLLK